MRLTGPTSASRRAALAATLASDVWALVRALTRDDAYERYLARHRAAGRADPLLSPAAFFAQRTRHDWDRLFACGRCFGPD